ncbi:MAG: hypothetical protein K5666_03195 [Bacilli bacterium]|nr:hypothetical protein [Bacilli bacterium]
MKKFFKKHDLFKIVGILMVLTALLTWIFRSSVFQNGELMTFSEQVKGLTSIMDGSTIGVFDFSAYLFLVFYIFSNIFVFIFVVYAFYKVLGKSKVYCSMLDKFANLFKGKEIVFAGISMLFYAALASVCKDFMIALAFIPFTVSIFNRLKVDKISTFASTFGGVLIGIIGATYSTVVVGSIIDYAAIAVKYGNELLAVIIVALIAYVILLSFVGIRIKNNNGKEVVADKFAASEEIVNTKKKKKNPSIIPMAVVFAVFAIITVMAFVPWEQFKITTFTKLHESIQNATLFGANYPSVFLGTAQLGQTQFSITALGTWDVTTLCSFMLLMMFVAKVVAGIKLNKLIDGIGEGLRLAIKPAILLAMIYTILAFSVSYPVIPLFINGINKVFSANALKPIGWFINMFITVLFTGDVQYSMSVIGGLFSTFKNESVVAFAMQVFYGLSGFIAPSSVVLMLGLSMLNIKFKDYLKFIWKFLLALLVILLVVIYILLFV